MGLVKFLHLCLGAVGPNRPYYQCLLSLASANGAVAGSNPSGGRSSVQTIVLTLVTLTPKWLQSRVASGLLWAL